jgi:Spy/CpxP family protein refolding chaperone
MSVTTAGINRNGIGLPGRRTLIAVLAISVALNLCVVAGAVWGHLNKPPPSFREHFRQLGDTLNLTPPQRVAFDQYVADMTVRGERMSQKVEPTMDAAFVELAKPDADEAHVLQLLDGAVDHRRAFLHDAVTATMSLLDKLTPEQRAKFITEEREFRAAQRRHRAQEAH